ncbi:AAA family ATPase [Micromonospora sp. NPDC048909]|uniref:ATP-dependent nuclease n=1 Tax=Micromonospora sp. NPDC048909 TaxID=3155643 RepID=UPI0034082FD9
MHLSKVVITGFRASANGVLECTIPGRFSVLLGANNAGKSTICDAVFLGHRLRFPRLPNPPSATLGPGGRSIMVEYSYAASPTDEGPLGTKLQLAAGTVSTGIAGTWTYGLRRDLGRVATNLEHATDLINDVRVIYLPAWRNPVDDLARREARVLVELLRAQQQRLTGTRNLRTLRGMAAGLLDTLAQHEILQSIEQRVGEHLRHLTAGVSRQWPFVRGQAVNDEYLARVLELMLATVADRAEARQLEISGLGYVNLLHIAVTLAAIPDSTALHAADTAADVDAMAFGTAPGGETVTPGIDELMVDQPEGVVSGLQEPGDDLDAQVRAATARLAQAKAERDSEDDSFFPSTPFHATVVIEEPEAHLHPQLQHALARYLRQVVDQRPELQVILSSHATDIVTSCLPEELVVVRRTASGAHVTRPVGLLPRADRDKVLRFARLHMDATRSAALFSERVVFVEGVTEAAVLRLFGRVWAGDDTDKAAFVDALTITVMGWKVGEWPAQLLATPGYELATRVAVLADSDKQPDASYGPPAWVGSYDQDTLRYFISHPTLEPSLLTGNEDLFTAALHDTGLDVPEPLDVAGVYRLFASRSSDGTRPEGPGKGLKAQFSLNLAQLLEHRVRTDPATITVPGHIAALYDFLSDPNAALADPVTTDLPF